MNEMSIESIHKRPPDDEKSKTHLEIASIKRALNDDLYCGDQCAFWQSNGKTFLCIVDGLGHGEHAEHGAKAALEYVGNHLSETLPDIFAGCDRAIRKTRGAAMGIAVVDEKAQTLTYSGICNTRANIYRKNGFYRKKGYKPQADEVPILLNNDRGIVGGGFQFLGSETIKFLPGDMVVLFTDGVTDTLDIYSYPPNILTDPQKLAEKIIQDWSLGTDDACALVCRSCVP